MFYVLFARQMAVLFCVGGRLLICVRDKFSWLRRIELGLIFFLWSLLLGIFLVFFFLFDTFLKVSGLHYQQKIQWYLLNLLTTLKFPFWEKTNLFSLSFIFIYFEREIESKQGRGRERGRQESQAGSALSAQSLMQGSHSRTGRSWPESESDA